MSTVPAAARGAVGAPSATADRVGTPTARVSIAKSGGAAPPRAFRPQRRAPRVAARGRTLVRRLAAVGARVEAGVHRSARYFPDRGRTRCGAAVGDGARSRLRRRGARGPAVGGGRQSGRRRARARAMAESVGGRRGGRDGRGRGEADQSGAERGTTGPARKSRRSCSYGPRPVSPHPSPLPRGRTRATWRRGARASRRARTSPSRRARHERQRRGRNLSQSNKDRGRRARGHSRRTAWRMLAFARAMHAPPLKATTFGDATKTKRRATRHALSTRSQPRRCVRRGRDCSPRLLRFGAVARSSSPPHPPLPSSKLATPPSASIPAPFSPKTKRSAAVCPFYVVVPIHTTPNLRLSFAELCRSRNRPLLAPKRKRLGCLHSPFRPPPLGAREREAAAADPITPSTHAGASSRPLVGDSTSGSPKAQVLSGDDADTAVLPMAFSSKSSSPSRFGS